MPIHCLPVILLITGIIMGFSWHFDTGIKGLDCITIAAELHPQRLHRRRTLAPRSAPRVPRALRRCLLQQSLTLKVAIAIPLGEELTTD